MALVLKVVKPETMTTADFNKLHSTFCDSFVGSPAYIGVEICVSSIDTISKTGETMFPVIIGNDNAHNTTMVLNGEDLFKSMHKTTPEDFGDSLPKSES